MAVQAWWIPAPWRGRIGIVARPRGGDWLDEDIRAWRATGIDHVVSALEPGEEAELDLLGEPASVRASGMTFDALPVPDRGVPSSRHAVAEAADRMVKALQSGKTVVVHCRQSIGRSAMLAAAILIAGGVGGETALTAIGEARNLEVPETPTQRRWILDFASWLSHERAARRRHAADGAPRRG